MTKSNLQGINPEKPDPSERYQDYKDIFWPYSSCFRWIQILFGA